MLLNCVHKMLFCTIKLSFNSDHSTLVLNGTEFHIQEVPRVPSVIRGATHVKTDWIENK